MCVNILKEEPDIHRGIFNVQEIIYSGIGSLDGFFEICQINLREEKDNAGYLIYS